jgi:hypothetical protein
VCTGTASAVSIFFGKSTEIFQKNGMFFSPAQATSQTTTIHHESTINSPQKYHQKTPYFSKTPSKTPVKAQKSPGHRRGLFSCKNCKISKR